MSSDAGQVEASELEVVAIGSVNSADYVARVFRCYESGSIVMIRPSGAAAAEVPEGVRIVGEETPARSHGWHRFSLAPNDGDDPAHLCFTSGTTGIPKGILLSHRALKDVVDRLNDAMRLESDVREYVGVPVNYSFGFGRCRAVAAVGGACHIPEHGFNPLELADMIKAGEVNAISAVPTQWRAFFQLPHLLGDAGRGIRWIEIGSQWMNRSEKERMKALFPNAVILQHYGLTEASRTTFLDVSETSGEELESVGRAVGRTEVEVSEDGRIRIRGPHVGLGELRDGIIRPLVDEDGWLQTNDLGSIRDGCLYYGGRADDLINCGGTKVPSEQFEKALLQELGVAGGLAVGPVADEMRGQAILVVADRDCVAGRDEVEEAARSVATRFGVGGAGVFRFARCESIPRTATGKVKRRELAGVAAASSPRRDAPDRPEPAPSTVAPDVAAASGTGDVTDQIVSAWRSVLGVKSVPMDKSFTDLGGDSLSMIAVMLQIERLRIPSEIARKVFEGKTIQQIVDDLEGRESSLSASQICSRLGNRVINTVRGLLVLLVIGVHWLPGVWARLPGGPVWMDELLHPLYRLGTPGFAMVFGLGWGYFQVPIYRSNPKRVMAAARRNASIILGGLLFMAAASAADLTLAPGPVGPPGVFVRSFYTVLTFYFLAVLASPLLLLPLARSRHVIATSLSLALTAFVGSILARALVPQDQGHGVLEVARLMLVARYNVFIMLSATFLGAALGAAYRDAVDSATLSRLPLKRLGVCLVGFGLLVTHQTVGLSAWKTTSGQEPWALATYLGLIMTACGCIQAMFEAPRLPRLVRKAIESLSIIGILALPAFVLHESVIPASHVLRRLGAPGVVAIALPLGVFLGVMGYFYSELRRLHVSGSSVGDSAEG